jgi:EAL domain-containing protein (putative c-di-GMP-specific phosphodiesterase class I)
MEKSFHQMQMKSMTGLVSLEELQYETNLWEETQRKKSEIFLALQEDRVVPFFQPIMEINSCTPFSYEVLMRFREGEDYLSPMPFVKVAEEINLISELDNRMLIRALEYKKKIDEEDSVMLFFNLSAKELVDETFLANAKEIIDNMQVKRQNICWEITESSELKDIQFVSELVLKYKNYGFAFAIDDFGTGFSSVNYLQQIPANFVKIDGSIIKKITSNEQNFFLVCSLVNLAKAFNMAVIAEYVENEDIIKKIKEANINLAQGYYYVKPGSEFLDAGEKIT